MSQRDLESAEAIVNSPFPLTEADRLNLTQTNDQFQPHTWDELKALIAQNRLEQFQRYPSDLLRYIRWSTDIKSRYGSVPNYVMRERLKWMPSPATTPETGPLFEYDSPVPFQSPADYKILPNDWPYGLAPGITHLIVWLRNRLDSEPERGDLTPKARMQVEEFIQDKFMRRVQSLPGPADKVLWFKNWTALQSVPGMDHVHVLVRNVPDDIITEWTEGEPVIQSVLQPDLS